MPGRWSILIQAEKIYVYVPQIQSSFLELNTKELLPFLMLCQRSNMQSAYQCLYIFITEYISGNKTNNYKKKKEHPTYQDDKEAHL